MDASDYRKNPRYFTTSQMTRILTKDGKRELGRALVVWDGDGTPRYEAGVLWPSALTWRQFQEGLATLAVPDSVAQEVADHRALLARQEQERIAWEQTHRQR